MKRTIFVLALLLAGLVGPGTFSGSSVAASAPAPAILCPPAC